MDNKNVYYHKMINELISGYAQSQTVLKKIGEDMIQQFDQVTKAIKEVDAVITFNLTMMTKSPKITPDEIIQNVKVLA